jgi:uncharacterized RDD family membrane protein YckC
MMQKRLRVAASIPFGPQEQLEDAQPYARRAKGLAYPRIGTDTLEECPLASWWERVGAFLLDEVGAWVFWIVAVLIVTSASSSLTPAKSISWEVPAFVIVPQLIYFAVLDGRYQSVGKLVVGIAVRDEDSGQPIGFQRALRRWLLYLLYWALVIPGVVASLSPLWDARRQSWHDEAVGSVVVKVR